MFRLLLSSFRLCYSYYPKQQELHGSSLLPGPSYDRPIPTPASPMAIVMQSETCCSPRENLYPFLLTTRHECSSEHYAVVRLGMYSRSISLAFATSTYCINTLYM